jgi:hypothetical protein
MHRHSIKCMRTGQRVRAIGRSFGLLCFWILAASSHDAAADGDQITPQQVQAEWRRAATIFQEAYRNVHVDGVNTLKVERFRPPKSPAIPRIRQSTLNFSYMRTGADQKLALTREGPVRPDDEDTGKPQDVVVASEFVNLVYVDSGKHAFTVSRKSPGSAYYLSRSDKSGSEDRQTSVYRRKILEAPFNPGGCSEFPACLLSPQFKVTDVERASGPEGSLVKAGFDYNPGHRNRQLRGRVCFDTSSASGWFLREFEFEVIDPGRKEAGVGKIAGSVRYEKRAGVPVPIEGITNESVGEKVPTATVTLRIQYSKFEFVETPPAEFTLAAYGLGDFESPSRRKANPTPYYAALVAVVALALGAILQRTAGARRRRGEASREVETGA